MLLIEKIAFAFLGIVSLGFIAIQILSIGFDRVFLQGYQMGLILLAMGVVFLSFYEILVYIKVVS